MLGLLPELNDEQHHSLPLRDIAGPTISSVDFPPELASFVRDLELGRTEPQPLLVCQHTHRLVLLGNQEQLFLYLAYKLGAFSTVPVKYVQMTTKERSLNAAAITTVTAASQQKLWALLDQPTGEATLVGEATLDDYPEEDDGWTPEEEEPAP